MLIALIALLVAGEASPTTTPPAAATAQPAPAGAPQGVVGVDLPAFPRPVRPAPQTRETSGERPSPQLGFNSIPMLGEASTRPPATPTESRDDNADDGPRCRRRQTANGFVYSCGDPATARELEDQTERMLEDLLKPR